MNETLLALVNHSGWRSPLTALADACSKKKDEWQTKPPTWENTANCHFFNELSVRLFKLRNEMVALEKELFSEH